MWRRTEWKNTAEIAREVLCIMVKLCKRVLLVALICAFMMNSVCLAAEYTLSDPDTLEIGDVKDVVFINESIVFIDGQFYPYTARAGYFDWVSLSPSRALYEWDYVAKKDLCFFGINPHPEIPVRVRCADGEIFDSMVALMYHIYGYLVRHEEIPVLVDLA